MLPLHDHRPDLLRLERLMQVADNYGTYARLQRQYLDLCQVRDQEAMQADPAGWERQRRHEEACAAEAYYATPDSY